MESNDNFQTVKNYIEQRKQRQEIEDTTANTQFWILTKYVRCLNKPLVQATEQDIINFLEHYNPDVKDNVIVMLRGLYRYLNNLKKNDELPECLRNIKLRSSRMKRKAKKEISTRDRIISSTEYEMLIEKADNPEHKALIETLYFYGVRISELLSMRATDVQDNGKLVKITVRDSKTEPRDVITKRYPKYLLEWYNTYQPFKGQHDKPLWISHSNRNTDGPLKKGGALSILKKIAKRAGIQKNITCHDFRHTAITRDLAEGMPDSFIKTNYGLDKDTKQLSTYDHNSTKELEKYLLEQTPISRPEPYDVVVHERDELINKHEKEIKNLNEKLNELKWLIIKDSHKKGEQLWAGPDNKPYVKFHKKFIEVTFDEKKQKLPKNFKLKKV